MPELIERQAALKKMCETCGYCERLENAMRSTHPDFVTDKCNNYKFLAEQPTIEAGHVRHGRWKGWTTSKFTGKYADYDEPVFKDYVYYTCSECYRKSAIQELYCPQCGARMDGGADNG